MKYGQKPNNSECIDYSSEKKKSFDSERTIDRYTLIDAFISRREITLKGVTGVITGLSHEDGSGYNFNVKIQKRSLTIPETVFVACLKPEKLCQQK